MATVLFGPSALSEFRKHKLLSRHESLKDVRAYHVHVVQGAQSPELEVLLKYGSQWQNTVDETDELLLQYLNENAHGSVQAVPSGWSSAFVYPRTGTITPWSSKATDIARICHLNVERIERGTAYFFKNSASSNVIVSTQLKAAIHDKMTHIVHDSIPQASQLFEKMPPKPLVFVDLISAKQASIPPIQILEKANREWVIENNPGTRTRAGRDGLSGRCISQLGNSKEPIKRRTNDVCTGKL